MSKMHFSLHHLTCLVLSLLATGCSQEMMNQRRVESDEEVIAFSGDTASRALPESTVQASGAALQSISSGMAPLDAHSSATAFTGDDAGYRDGMSDGEIVNAIPKAVADHDDYRALIERGRERYNISCVPCHDLTGSGNGMVPQRGFPYPPSYHTARLRQKPLGYFFRMATYGRGKMPAFGDLIPIDDRWAIAAYVRTLQFSQFADQSELSAQDRANLPAREAVGSGGQP